MRTQNLQWAPDPCQKEQEAVDQLMEAEEGGGGDKVATQQLGGAPAPQLAQTGDPVPNLDPAVPENEFVTPEPGAHNQWVPMSEEELRDFLLEALNDHSMDIDIDQILNPVRILHLWCPWGGPGVTDMKWAMHYKPKNSKWVGKWLP
uniref:Nucleoprotein n=1 Tax=Chestnut teal chaphamaparvovirus TaxID=2759402 RepID=A0A7D7B415_9VIRU|nr:nucleoprotein [Chestnut teal chaphamaparvovirus]